VRQRRLWIELDSILNISQNHSVFKTQLNDGRMEIEGQIASKKRARLIFKESKFSPGK
jgi:hypothetical protein